MKRKTLFSFLFIGASFFAHAQLFLYHEKLNNMFGTPGAMELKDSLLFMGNGIVTGDRQFTASSSSKGIIIFDADSPQKILKIFNAEAATAISDYISDGNGGFYVAGYFSVFDGVNIFNQTIIRIKKDFTVVKYSLNFNGTLNKIALFNDRIIATGAFTIVNSSACNNIAALDTTNLLVINSFVPSFNSTSFKTSTRYKNNLLLLGTFVQAGKTYKVISVDPMSGNIVSAFENLTFTPTNCCVWNDIAFLSSDVKITNPVSHGFLFALNLTDSLLSNQVNIRANNLIYAMNVANNKLYLSLYKSAAYDTITVNGITFLSQGLATIDLHQLSLLPTLFPVDDLNYKILAYKDKLFRCGTLNSTQNNIQHNFFASDTTSNTVINPDFPLYKSPANNMAVSNNYGMVDYFSGLNYDPRLGVGILNLKTMKFLKFNPNITSASGVNTIKVVDSIVFFCGFFNKAEGITVNNFVAYNYINNSIDTSYNLKFNAIVSTMEILNDSILLIAGQFTVVNGLARSGLIAYNYRIKRISSNYQAMFTGTISKIKKVDSLVFFSGPFNKVNSISKSNLICATVNGLSFNFNYGNFMTANSSLSKVVTCNHKFYFISVSATDTNILVFDSTGNTLPILSFPFQFIKDITPLGNYMFYGGTFYSFASSFSYRNIMAARSTDEYPDPDNSILNYTWGVDKMISWGDSVVFYFANSTINKINITSSAYIESPISPSTFLCKSFANVEYKASGVFNPGNHFILEASKDYAFTSPILLGTTTSVSTNGIIYADFSALSQNTTYCYRIRSDAPAINGYSTGFVNFKRPTGVVSLLSGDTNCLAYSYGSYVFTIVNAFTLLNISITNCNKYIYYNSSEKLLVKWNDGPQGVINIVARDINSCPLDTFKINVTIQMSPYNGIRKELEKEVLVFPNVFDRNIEIENQNNHELSVSLYNTEGKMVLHDQIAQSTQLPAENLAAGFYILLIQNETESVYFKLIKK